MCHTPVYKNQYTKTNVRTLPSNTEVFFARFYGYAGKEDLLKVSVIEIQKENLRRDHAYFRDNKQQQFFKAVKYKTNFSRIEEFEKKKYAVTPQFSF